jgi:hypothetical protein
VVGRQKNHSILPESNEATGEREEIREMPIYGFSSNWAIQQLSG